MEPEPGQSDGSGSSQIPRLRAAPAPKPCSHTHTPAGCFRSRMEDVRKVLSHYLSKVEGLLGIVLTDRDGIPIVRSVDGRESAVHLFLG